MKVGMISFVIMAGMSAGVQASSWVSEVLDKVEQEKIPQEMVRPKAEKSPLRPDTLDLLDERVRYMVNQRRNSAR